MIRIALLTGLFASEHLTASLVTSTLFLISEVQPHLPYSILSCLVFRTEDKKISAVGSGCPRGTVKASQSTKLGSLPGSRVFSLVARILSQWQGAAIALGMVVLIVVYP